jgi:hypothetical protein
MTYNRTLNKLVILFGSITDKRQVPMAVAYAKLLVKNLDLTTRGTCCDYEGWYVRDELLQLIKRNENRILSER